MRVLITGGSGYIGFHLAAQLQADGQIVRVLDPRPVPPAIVEVPPYRVHLGSAATPSIAARAVDGMDAVVHLGWAFDGGAVGKVVCANLLSTVNLLEAGLREGIRRFVFVSTAVVYGPTGDRKATERGRTATEPVDDRRPVLRGHEAGLRGVLRQVSRARASGDGPPPSRRVQS
jgi:UDP-glucose 4-epimerase